MRIALTQMDIVWEDKEANLQQGETLLKQAAQAGAELLIFPEMSFTGFSMQVDKIAEPVVEQSDGIGLTATCLRMLEDSRRYGLAIVFGYVRKAQNGKGLNCLMAVDNGRVLAQYDKLHPFTYGEEGKHYQGGDHLACCAIRGVKFSFFICYDLRFPEIFQAVSGESEAIVVIANWPGVRVKHWRLLLQARAVENQCYMLGVNRIGEGAGIVYEASSMVVNPYGEVLTEVGQYLVKAETGLEKQEKSNQELLLVDIAPDCVTAYRQEFPLKQDRRPNFYAEKMLENR